MSLAFTEEQEELRRIVRRFVEETAPSAEVRRLMATTDGFDPTVWKRMAAELGLQGIAIPEALGGQGLGPVELGIALEEMGRLLHCSPFFSTVCLGATAIAAAGTQDQRAELLPGIASGDSIATLALAEPNGRWDAEGITATAAGDSGEGFRLTGTKSFVLDGNTASLIVVAARRPGTSGQDGVGLFVVRGDADGLARTPLATLDQTRKQAALDFAGVAATALGPEPYAGWPALAKTLDQVAVYLSAEMVGGAQRCLDMAVDYAKNRVQFGRPIGSFQAVKHRCADMLLAVESARAASSYALWVVAEEGDELPIVAPLSKAYCSEAYFQAATDNIQIHGGMGFTWEHDAHLYFRRAKSSELLFGDPTYHRELLAQRLGI